jgi:cytochrome c biogenesis protein CcmG, thiol:disulfide interchange protein DsbE
MGALTLGPLVLSLDRAYAALGFIVLIVAAEVWARRGRPEVANWAWGAALAAFAGARLGFVLTNLQDYAAAPWTALAVWQGGFAPWWGVAAGAATSVWSARRHPAVRRAAPALGVAAVLAWWLPTGLLSPAPGDLGIVMPSLTLPALDGTAVELAAAGQPTVVNVWATWCPPCRREMPLLIAAARETPDVRVLLVNQRETSETVRAFLVAQGLPEDGVLLDRTGAVGNLLDVAGLPTTFAFDAHGQLAAVHVGEISAAALRGLIDRAR